MTVSSPNLSSSKGREYTVGEILLRSAQSAGLVPAEGNLRPAQRELGRFHLETVLDDLQSRSVMARSRTFYLLDFTSADVTAQTYKFTLPEYVLQVVGDGMYIPSTASDTDRADGETVVTKVDWERWHRMSSKGATSSRPNMLYEHREARPVEAWFWPIPSDAGAVRIPIERYLSDVDDDDATIDLEPYWMSYLVRQMEERWSASSSMSVEQQALRQATANNKLNFAKSKAGDKDPIQILPFSSTRYR